MMRRGYPSAIAEIHLRGVLALFLMLAVAALVTFVHPSLVAMGPVAFVPLIGGGFSPPIPSLLDAAVSSRVASVLPALPAAGTSENAIKMLYDTAAGGAPNATSIVGKLNTIITQTAAPAGFIAGTQYGSINMAGAVNSGTATITSVDLTRSYVVFLGEETNQAAAAASFDGYLALTNSTTVTATRLSNAGPSDSYTVYFVVVTITAGLIKSLQSGSLAISNPATSAAATITSVTVGKAWVLYLGHTLSGSNQLNGAMVGLTLTNATTVTGTILGSGAGSIGSVYFVVLESN